MSKDPRIKAEQRDGKRTYGAKQKTIVRKRERQWKRDRREGK